MTCFGGEQLRALGGHCDLLYRDTPEFDLSAATQQQFLREHLISEQSRD